MADKLDANIGDEIEQRLEDLFGDDASDFEAEESDSAAPLKLEKDNDVIQESPVIEEEDVDEFEDSPLKELKSIVLSIEWEISDKIMTKFLKQVDRLSGAYKDERIASMFLQLLGSTGRYIKSKKENSDPDVVKLLNSAYAGLEQVLLKKSLTETDKKKLLAAEINKFKKIKEHITGKKVEKMPVVAPVEEVPKPSAGAPIEEVSETAPKTEETVEQKPAIISAPFTRKGIGFGSKIAMLVFFPLVVISAATYMYVRRLTTIPGEIDQIFQTFLGIPVESIESIVLAVFCGLVVLFGLIATLYVSSISGKIKKLTKVVEGLCEGNKDVPIKITSKGDLGVLVEAVRRLRDK